ncbi:hypothetical protein A2U01_0113959, partial [Trifolium medium]|nr:hypothetical protein [Trifolium medium]
SKTMFCLMKIGRGLAKLLLLAVAILCSVLAFPWHVAVLFCASKEKLYSYSGITISSS